MLPPITNVNNAAGDVADLKSTFLSLSLFMMIVVV